MNAEELLYVHMRLECIQVIPPHFLSRINCPNPDDIHRFYVVKMHPTSHIKAFYRWDLESKIQAQLQTIELQSIFLDDQDVRAILDQPESSREVFKGKSYIFPQINADEHSDVRASQGGCEIVIDDTVASRCESSRENEEAAEAWVYTHPQYRRRGFARQVTLAWAYHLQQQRKIPFYSHRIENTASERVARSLSLIQYIDDIGFL